MVLRFGHRKVVCDVREEGCLSRKQATKENTAHVKEALNVAVFYWHYVRLTEEIGKLVI
jgi:hypothetical protein